MLLEICKTWRKRQRMILRKYATAVKLLALPPLSPSLSLSLSLSLMLFSPVLPTCLQHAPDPLVASSFHNHQNLIEELTVSKLQISICGRKSAEFGIRTCHPQVLHDMYVMDCATWLRERERERERVCLYWSLTPFFKS